MSALMAIGRLMRQRGEGEDFEPGTFWLLHSLRCQGAIRLTDLAAKLGLDASTVSRHITHLEKKSGLVERTPDPLDGRAQLLKISPKGRQLLDLGLARRRARLTGHFENWDRDDVETLERLLNRFVQEVNDTESELETK